MVIRSIRRKVVQAEKREFNTKRKDGHSGSSFFSFWLCAVTGAVLLASVSYITSNGQNPARADQIVIDPGTTSSVSRSARNVNLVERRKQVAEQIKQNRRLNDVTRVIHRLRSEQAALNSKVAELDASLVEMRALTKALKTELKKATAKPKVAKVVIPEETPKTSNNNGNIDTPRSAQLIPDGKWSNPIVKEGVLAKQKSSATPTINRPIQEISSGDQISSNAGEQKVVSEKKSAALNSDVSTLKKIAPPLEVPPIETGVDPSVVGGINRAQSSTFGIDLGVNPTRLRAQDLWNTLTEENRGLLGPLREQYLPTGKVEGETRLVAGPYNDASDAIRACVQLRSSKAFCKTTLYSE